MSDQEKTIASLKNKGFLDDQTLKHLRNRLNSKLKIEENEQKRELILLQDKLTTLQASIIN